MQRLLNKRQDRCERGNAVLEFALMVPVLLLILGGLTEFGRAFFQSHAVEKGIRAAALLAATEGLPMDAGTLTAATNLAKTGTVDGSGAPLVPGWADSSAKLTFTPLTYKVGGRDVQVVRLTAEVPYIPLFPVATKNMGFGAYTIKLRHEQAHVE